VTAVPQSRGHSGATLFIGIRRWQLWSLPRPAVGFVLLVDALALVTLALGLRMSPLRLADVGTFAGLTLCGLVSVEGSRRLGSPASRQDRPYRDLLTTWTLPVAVLLPPVYAVLVPVPLYALAQWRVNRQPAMKRVFNTAAMAVAGFAAANLHSVLADRPAPYSLATLVQGPRQAGAVLVTAVVPAVVSTLLVAIVLRLAMPGISWRRALGTRDGLALDLVEACLGILLAVGITVAPELLVLALPPVLLLQRTLLHAELLEAARTDAKTGLANPAHWRTVAERELRRARQGGEPLAVLMVDIDHFKAVNDDYGHVVGDRVLAAVGAELQAGVRPRDLVGRFGGEEFAVLLPGTSLTAAEQTAQRLRRRVQQLTCPAGPGGRPVQVTISVGVAVMRSPAVDVTGLVDAADAALYRKWPRNSCHSPSVGVRYSSLGRRARRRARNARWAWIASVG